MSEFRVIAPSEMDPIFDRIKKGWFLLSASDGENTNTMTVSWATVGELWNKAVAICYVRPQRHTFGILEKTDRLTLTALSEDYRAAMTFCGRASGRDCDKFKEAGLTCAFTEEGTPYVAEGETILVCKKLYADDIRESAFVDTSLIEKVYAEKDFHRFYVCEIEKVLVK